MDEIVSLAGYLSGEAPSADVALVGPLPSMCFQVVFEVGRLHSGVLAERAEVSFGWLLSR